MAVSVPADVIDEALSVISSRRYQIDRYRQYVMGNQRLAFSTDKFWNAFGSMFRAFAVNYCKVVVDIMCDHLLINGMTSRARGAGIEGDDIIDQIWHANDMSVRYRTLHEEALVSGEAFAIVWPDEHGFPVIYPNPAALFYVEPSAERPWEISWAIKVWQEGKTWRMNLYLEDHIERYYTEGNEISSKKLMPYREHIIENPYGVVPVFRFVNRPTVSWSGQSEIDDIIPLQDSLNKTWMDLLVAMEFQALPQRWITGIEVDIDPDTGKVRPPFTAGADRVWAVPFENARLGQFEAADLSPFITVATGIIQHIAAETQIPVHYLIPPTAVWPSGESLWATIQGFRRKIEGKQASFGATWEALMRFALRILGRDDLSQYVTCVWGDPTPVREMERASAGILKRRLGVPLQQILAELGYDDDTIAIALAEASAREAAEKNGDGQSDSPLANDDVYRSVIDQNIPPELSELREG